MYIKLEHRETSPHNSYRTSAVRTHGAVPPFPLYAVLATEASFYLLQLYSNVTENFRLRLSMSDRQTCLTAVQEKLPNEAGDVFVAAMSGMLLGAQKPMAGGQLS